ncbi:hypothetical protein L202_02144 [Cryptococcus amylolentus CBS 6039]|uniref:Zn(2)-C6 fungal-type domain-containing protein n=2 Tax=Cryptococcus amylolentus TaxID=104669 RepID=A0A1E3I1Q5_9TREE|nr:hypothetical protein L202_02144 [Cryptococcus amylolentus CBS 6039]ODN81761.1 hypothetical protein L202_02144 [Cryptococcus amylolentus CBS 6039]ODO10049.1 hypothetical protein I350_02274 [Cryptococcus amylolentus CBS 6273]
MPQPAHSPPAAHPGDTAPPSRKRKRKQRPVFSCAECRRLKLKCDRQVPCNNCVRRQCHTICPEGVRITRQYLASSDSELATRLEHLEGIVSRHGLEPIPERGRSKSSTKRISSPSPSARDLQEPPSGSANASSGPRADQDPTPRRTSARPTFDFETASSTSAARNEPPGQSPITISPYPSHPFQYDIPEHSPAPGAQPLSPFPSRASQISPHVHDGTGENKETIKHSPDMDTEGEQSHGTLVISHGGRSKYLGPTAASEWLRDQETRHDEAGSSDVSRETSPELSGVSVPSVGRQTHRAIGSHTFPFTTYRNTDRSWSRHDILAKLPDKEYADMLVDSYYRTFSWHYDICPRPEFKPLYQTAYRLQDMSKSSPQNLRHERMNYQDLGLVFMILAYGTLQCLELPPDDPTAYELAAAAQIALTKGNLLSKPSLSGLEALHILAHFGNASEEGRSGDAAWPIWGLAMRLIQAMGLHRDGAKWNLPPDVVEARRRVFWECHASDIYIANCNSRPNTLGPGVYDTAIPTQPPGELEKNYMTLKWEFSEIAASTVRLSTSIRAPPYSTVMEVSKQALDFERQVPFDLRCRPALQALPGVYPDPQAAIDDSPDINSKQIHKTLRRTFLFISISETLLFLHRPYFVRALLGASSDPSQSMYAPSYLTVIERCNAIIQCVVVVYKLHPNVSARQWPLWYHSFNCAVSMGSLVLKSPQNSLSELAFSLLETVIRLFTSAVQAGSSPRLTANLEWLTRLHHQCQQAVNAVRHGGSRLEPSLTDQKDLEDPENLLGWRTRLVERASARGQVATSISQASSAPPSNASPDQQAPLMNGPLSFMSQPASGGVPHGVAAYDLALNDNGKSVADTIEGQGGSSNEAFTNNFLQSFWDPMLQQDAPIVEDETWNSLQSVNWWDWNMNWGQAGGSGEPSQVYPFGST